LELEGAAV